MRNYNTYARWDDLYKQLIAFTEGLCSPFAEKYLISM